MTDVRSLSDRSDVPSFDSDNRVNQASAEAQSLMRTGAVPPVAQLDSNVWPSVDFVVADATPGRARGTAADRHSQKTPPKDNCPGNEAFKMIMDRAARHIYDPKALGDLNAIMKSNACVASSADAVRRADRIMEGVGDPYTDVLPEKEAREMQAQMQGHLSGVGVQIGRLESAPGTGSASDGPISVQRVFPNSPAESVGLRKGDLITAVDGKDISKMSTDEVATKLLRGKEGTDAKISILRDGKPMTIDVKRADYEFPSVTDERMGDYAYIRMEDMLNENTADRFKKALERHQDAKGFILDLRDNGGGLVPNALLAASLIMEKGQIMSVRARAESDPAKPEYNVERYSLTPEGIRVTGQDDKDEIGVEGRMPDLVHKPLVVLTNEGTGSAAEILAGALKDNSEATLIGTKTFGKGIGQDVFSDMPGNSILKVTNFRFFTPSGQWIGDGHNNRIGITPNIVVENPSPATEYGSSSDAQLKAALAELNRATASKN